MAMLEQFLSQLSQDLELDLPPKDEQQMTLVPINSTLTVSIKALELGIFFFSKIAPCPIARREELFTLLMKANFLGQGTGGGVIGLDAEENFLTLSLALPYDMNYKTFKETLGDFANFVDYWREEIKRLSST